MFRRFTVKKSAKPEKIKFEWHGYVPCELNSKRKEQFREWQPGITTLEGFLDVMVMPGYKLSFSIDTYHDCLQVSWSCSAAGDPNSGWTLTARGNELVKALSVLWFKHHVMLEGQWDGVLPADEYADDIG